MNFTTWWNNFELVWTQLGWIDLLDIILVWLVVYQVLLFIRGTGAVQMLAGLGIVASSYFVSISLELDTLNWVLEQFFNNLFLIVVILFQHEIRRALAHIGRNPFFTGISAEQESEVIQELCQGISQLSEAGLGALFVIEREMGLENFIEKGTSLDAQVSSEIILSVFNPASPLHDGAMILQGGRITSAGSFLPLSKNPNIDKSFGTRHRAALGLSEESDAFVIVVSEENRSVSWVVDGVIEKNVETSKLRKKMFELFGVNPERAK